MSCRALAWLLLAVLACGAVVLFNYWADYQPLSTLAYTGMVAALCGLANVAVPFRFLGVRKRVTGALICGGGVGLAVAALYWPAPTVRVEHARSRLDELMPEYQFHERHATRIHARPEQVVRAIRESTFGDMTSLVTLLKIRGAVLRTPFTDTGLLQKRVLDAFAEAGYVPGGSETEILMCGAVNVREQRPAGVRTLQEFAAYREPGAVKMGYHFAVAPAGDGWTAITTETRVAAPDGGSRGMGVYWRLIVPGSGLLRRQWLEGIKRRAESMPG